MAEHKEGATKKAAEFFKGARDAAETIGYPVAAVVGAVASIWSKSKFLKVVGGALSFWFLGTLAREFLEEK